MCIFKVFATISTSPSTSRYCHQDASTTIRSVLDHTCILYTDTIRIYPCFFLYSIIPDNFLTKLQQNTDCFKSFLACILHANWYRQPLRSGLTGEYEMISRLNLCGWINRAIGQSDKINYIGEQSDHLNKIMNEIYILAGGNKSINDGWYEMVMSNEINMASLNSNESRSFPSIT